MARHETGGGIGAGPSERASERVFDVCDRYGRRTDALLEILWDIQESAGCISDGDLAAIAEVLNLSRAEVHGVCSFYSDFVRTAKGRYVVRVCRAEACRALGSDAVTAALEERLGTALGTTRNDGAVTLEAVYCLGHCSVGPAAMVNARPLARATAEKIAAEVDRG